MLGCHHDSGWRSLCNSSHVLSSICANKCSKLAQNSKPNPFLNPLNLFRSVVFYFSLQISRDAAARNGSGFSSPHLDPAGANGIVATHVEPGDRRGRRRGEGGR